MDLRKRPHEGGTRGRPEAVTPGVDTLVIWQHIDIHRPTVFGRRRAKLGPELAIWEWISPGRLNRKTSESLGNGVVIAGDVESLF